MLPTPRHHHPHAIETRRHPDTQDRDAQAQAIAQAMLDGFNRHYRLFRSCSQVARRYFETGDWLAIQHASRDRIDFYDTRVAECVERLEREFGATAADDALWERVKLHYIGLLIEHRQPECAEVFFNSVSCKILHRVYFHNRFIFVRPTISTEHIDLDSPAYRSYYPRYQGVRHSLMNAILDLDLKTPFANFRADLSALLKAFRRRFARPLRFEANLQIQVLSSLFYRNRSAYMVGKLINGMQEIPFVVPIRHDREGKLYLDALLLEDRDLAPVFSANRAYFLVDMEAPAAYVQFLRSMMPYKTRAELYTIIGLQKAGKALFYRDFLHHLKHSTDRFMVAPGIKGLVMSVFTLPSYPYVFKVIKDVIGHTKETTRELVKQKYHLVKHHDRVGRMADTLEYSDVAFPKARFTPDLLEELRTLAPSQIEEEEGFVIIRHLYIERRMVPLNMYFAQGNDAQMRDAVREYGNALRELAAVNIFAGDLLFKNFGVTRYGRVVFYDYDEIEYLTDCNFRRIPAPRNEEDEMADKPWYPIGKNDIFPEEFSTFLLTDAKTRAYFLEYHAELLEADWWKSVQERIRRSESEDVVPYSQTLRFSTDR